MDNSDETHQIKRHFANTIAHLKLKNSERAKKETDFDELEL